MDDKLREAIMQALGEASMCWDEPPIGLFETDRAVGIGSRLQVQIESICGGSHSGE